MKKLSITIIALSCILCGCHSNKTPGNSTITAPKTDTSKMSVAPQPIDTSAKDGEVIRRYTNGIIKEHSHYIAGRRHGECQYFYPTGKLWSDEYFLNGVLDGPSTNYFDNGQKRYEGQYVKGKPAGMWKIYSTEGKLVKTINYDKKQNNPSM